MGLKSEFRITITCRDVMDSRAIFRMDARFYRDTILRPTAALIYDQCHARV